MTPPLCRAMWRIPPRCHSIPEGALRHAHVDEASRSVGRCSHSEAPLPQATSVKLSQPFQCLLGLPNIRPLVNSPSPRGCSRPLPYRYRYSAIFPSSLLVSPVRTPPRVRVWLMRLPIWSRLMRVPDPRSWITSVPAFMEVPISPALGSRTFTTAWTKSRTPIMLAPTIDSMLSAAHMPHDFLS